MPRAHYPGVRGTPAGPVRPDFFSLFYVSRNE